MRYLLKPSVELLRRSRLIEFTSLRGRASYHAENQKSFIPRSIRKLIYRHPMLPFGVILGVLVFIVTTPMWHGIYAQIVLDREDYEEYRRTYNRVILNRGRHGESLHIPFVTDDDSRGSFDFYLQKTKERKAKRYSSGNLPNAKPADE